MFLPADLPKAMISRTNLRGIASMLVATGTFVANDSCMKLVMADAPPLQVLAMRGIAACLWCLPLLVILGYGRELPHAVNRWVLLRSAFECVAILAFVFALPRMAIADITAIAQTSPLLVLVGAAVLWGERIGPVRWLFIALGIAGALMVAQPGSPTGSPFAALGFVTAAASALRDITSRRVAYSIPALVVTFNTLVTVMLCAVAGSLLFEEQVAPTSTHLLLIAMAGFFLMCGHFFIFMAFRVANAKVVAPFAYSFTLWAVLSGILVFGDFPNWLAIAGMLLITATGVAVVIFEGRAEKAPAQP
jgi:drug/metabolite transporter (DMT)-like permease